jgi:hypothetical protein
MTKFDRDVRAIGAALDRKDALIDDLVGALVSARVWVNHWQIDVDAGLWPTGASLASAALELDAAIEKARQP